MPAGPCVVCGDRDYPSSLGGPQICPACDCGVDPKRRKCEAKLSKLLSAAVKVQWLLYKQDNLDPELLAAFRQFTDAILEAK
jgi:hypothetical protein